MPRPLRIDAAELCLDLALRGFPERDGAVELFPPGRGQAVLDAPAVARDGLDPAFLLEKLEVPDEGGALEPEPPGERRLRRRRALGDGTAAPELGQPQPRRAHGAVA